MTEMAVRFYDLKDRKKECKNDDKFKSPNGDKPAPKIPLSMRIFPLQVGKRAHLPFFSPSFFFSL